MRSAREVNPRLPLQLKLLMRFLLQPTAAAAALACLLFSSSGIAAALTTQSARPATAPFSFHSESPGVDVNMSLIPADASKTCAFQAYVLLLSDKPPAALKRAPAGVTLRCVQIQFGEKTWLAALGSLRGGETKLYLDA